MRGIVLWDGEETLMTIGDAETFESHRSTLLALAYRMLGDMGRAEDMVQEAWVRWQHRQVEADSPKAFLLTTVTRLCMDELGSARVRHEESRSDRLPEPVDLDGSGLGRVEMMDQISMAFLVLLQRLTPAERAVFLLHEVFDMSHSEIGALLGKNDAACRQMLSRARENVAAEKRAFQTSPEEHRRLLLAFIGAISNEGEHERLLSLLAEDAVFVADAGPNGGHYGQIRNVGRPIVGRTKIAAFIRAAAKQDVPKQVLRERTLNGQPAIVVYRDGRPGAAIFVSVADGQIRHVFFQSDPARLQHIDMLN